MRAARAGGSDGFPLGLNMVHARSLQVTYLWRGQILAYHLLGPRDRVTIGNRKGVTFATPPLPGFPARFLLVTPVRDGFRLRVGPGMSGELTLRQQPRTVGDILAQPAVRRFLRDPGMFREVELYPGDTAALCTIAEGASRVRLSYAEPPSGCPGRLSSAICVMVRTAASPPPGRWVDGGLTRCRPAGSGRRLGSAAVDVVGADVQQDRARLVGGQPAADVAVDLGDGPARVTLVVLVGEAAGAVGRGADEVNLLTRRPGTSARGRPGSRPAR